MLFTLLTATHIHTPIVNSYSKEYVFLPTAKIGCAEQTYVKPKQVTCVTC